MIDLHDIRKTYVSAGKHIDAIRNVNLHINKGEVFGIIGRSGAGKSTLIRMLNLLERPSAGQVVVDGQDITRLGEAQLRSYRHGVGMIFQHFNLLRSRTVVDNICFPLRLAGMKKSERLARAQEMLELVDLMGHGHKYPGQLSGGQQQRVGIARALASGPRLLLGDEATSALDPQTTQSILDLLADINEKLQLTIVLITHSMDVIRRICDRVAVLEAGEVVETGDVLDVFLHPQHAATRALVAETGQGADQDWRELAQGVRGRLLRLSYQGAATGKPLLSRLSRDLQLDLSILQGSVGKIKHTAYGQLVVAVEGVDENLAAMDAVLQAAQVHYEVLRP